MKELPKIGMLWMRGSISFLEQLCIKSFVDAGHETILFTYGDVPNVPEGVIVKDASEIIPETGFLVHERTGSPALHSDLFRYHMFTKIDNIIWADTDAYCVKPFVTETGHFFGFENEYMINGGVLGLPQSSPALKELLEFTSDEYNIPWWYERKETRRLLALKEAGTPEHVSQMAWGVWGPHAITNFLRKTGESKYALPVEGLYPVSFRDRNQILVRHMDFSDRITENTFSIHFYGRRLRRNIIKNDNQVPKKGSLIGQLLRKHGIDPRNAPVLAKPSDNEDADKE